MALTAKQEAFAKAIARGGMNQSDAYSSVYDAEKMLPKSITDKASELARYVEVAARVDVLRARATDAAVKKAAFTLAEEIEACSRAVENAQAGGQVSAEVAAIKLRAQLGGHLVERKEVRSGPLTEADITSLARMLSEVDEKIRVSKEAAQVVGEVQPVPQPVRRVIG